MLAGLSAAVRGAAAGAAETVTAHAAQAAMRLKKDRQRRRSRRRMKKLGLGLAVGGVLFCAGYFLGIHHRAILAKLRGEELPAPHKHCLCRKAKEQAPAEPESVAAEPEQPEE